MFLRRVCAFRQFNIRGLFLRSTSTKCQITTVKLYTPELSSLPPAPHLRSLQYRGAKRGSIKPILNHEPIKLGARVDPTHPVLRDKSFQPLAAGNEYFDFKVYPSAMLKRLGVVFMPNGKLRPREPKELNFPVLKNKKRVKFASAVILAVKKIHKRQWLRLSSDVARTRLKRKILEAIKLVVTRGANVDPEHKRITFTESEAGEAKWVLRDWYYIIYPKPPAYHAPWPDLIRTTREALSKIVQKGAEWSSSWRVQLAERGGAAMARLARREMRRVRMWRRQEKEALARGAIAEDVGIRWKQKGVGIKKRRIGDERLRPGVGRRRVTVLRAPSRDDFKEGLFSSRKPREESALIRPTEWRNIKTEPRADASQQKLRPHDTKASLRFNSSPRTPTIEDGFNTGISRQSTKNGPKSTRLPSRDEGTTPLFQASDIKLVPRKEPQAPEGTRLQKSTNRARKREE